MREKSSSSQQKKKGAVTAARKRVVSNAFQIHVEVQLAEQWQRLSLHPLLLQYSVQAGGLSAGDRQTIRFLGELTAFPPLAFRCWRSSPLWASDCLHFSALPSVTAALAESSLSLVAKHVVTANRFYIQHLSLVITVVTDTVYEKKNQREIDI